ncbi:MAG TPA: protease modulator HflK, partial [Verrucomicrobiae bacterium]|nr:protease modulator HflK [Verrucomicrobiae bacterium]
AGLAAVFLARLTHSWVAQATLVFYLLGVLVAAVSYFQMRLEESERLEKLEYDELNKTPNQAALFSANEADILPARRSREQFEKWLAPLFTALLLGLQITAVYWLWSDLAKATPVALTQGKLAMALYGIAALILYLLGKYSAGLTRLGGARLLRPGASYLLLAAYLNFLTAVSIAATELGFPKFDLYAARVVVVVIGVVGVETLISLIFEIYRPRVRGQAARLLYDSRLTGLLGQPEGLFTTAAQALDYQFGFKVSETWFYRFLERALAWVILFQLLALWVSTAFVIIEPQEQALLERFGKPVDGGKVLDPGFHWKFPWPMDQIYRYSTREVQSFVIGVVPDPEMEKERVLVWTRAHNKEEYNLIVAAAPSSADSIGRTGADQAVPVNLLTVSIPVQYQITNLVAWAYHHAEAPELLESIASRELVRYMINVDLNSLMGTGRLDAANTLRERIQARANQEQLGANVVFVGLQDIHPPVKVAKEFEAVIGAMQERETNILAAVAYRNTMVPLARAEATNILTKAEAERLNKNATVAAEAILFTNQLAAFKHSPEVYTNRAFLDTVGRSVATARKYVLVTTNKTDVIQLNLEDKLSQDMLDVPLPSLKK